jgi:methyl-accepting chemotaxis protein
MNMGNSLSIGKKLGFGIGALALGNILILVLSVWFVTDADRNFTSLLRLGVTAETKTLEIARDMNYVSRLTRSIMLGDNYDKDMADIEAYSGKIVDAYAALKEAEAAAGDKAHAAELDAAVEESLADTRAFVDDGRNRMKALGTVDRTPEVLAAAWQDYHKEATPLAEKARDSFKKLSDLAGATLKRETDSTERDLHRMMNATIILNLAGLTLSVLVGLWLLRSIAPPLRRATEIAERIAAGDLTTRIDVHGNDETARMLATLGSMQNELRNLVQKIDGASSALAASAHEMVAASEVVAQNSADQGEATASAAAAMEEMTVSINHVSDNSADAQKVAQASERAAQEGRTVVQRAASEISGVAASMRQSAELMETLKRRSDEITSIVNVIKDIADQTNLLALNAAIEAARAGELGRGFAVVADEVRKLAERTTDSTQEISGMLGNLHEAISGMLNQIEDGVNKVASGREYADKADSMMDGVRLQAERVFSTVNEIAAALREQSQASNQVSSSMETVARMTDSNHGEIERVRSASRQLEGVAQELRQSISHLRI